MTAPQILLDPVDFDALHLSALAFGGIGGWSSFKDGDPWCAQGHAQWLDGVDPSYPNQLCGGFSPFVDRVREGDIWPNRNDDLIKSWAPRVPFEEYVELLNIDVKAVA